MALTSPAFPDGGDIPVRFTCDGRNVSPPLRWSGIPAAAGSLALIVRDPDAPAAPWVHWVLYDLPAYAGEIDEGASAPPGAHRGRNDWGRTGYGGPCPPSGRHRYTFELVALGCRLGDLDEPTAGDLEEVMGGHVLETARLTGRYAGD